jgi:hypothetical protein
MPRPADVLRAKKAVAAAKAKVERGNDMGWDAPGWSSLFMGHRTRLSAQRKESCPKCMRHGCRTSAICDSMAQELTQQESRIVDKHRAALCATEADPSWFSTMGRSLISIQRAFDRLNLAAAERDLNAAENGPALQLQVTAAADAAARMQHAGGSSSSSSGGSSGSSSSSSGGGSGEEPADFASGPKRALNGRVLYGRNGSACITLPQGAGLQKPTLAEHFETCLGVSRDLGKRAAECVEEQYLELARKASTGYLYGATSGGTAKLCAGSLTIACGKAPDASRSHHNACHLVQLVPCIRAFVEEAVAVLKMIIERAAAGPDPDEDELAEYTPSEMERYVAREGKGKGSKKHVRNPARDGGDGGEDVDVDDWDAEDIVVQSEGGAKKRKTFLHDGPTQLTDEHIKACIADTSDITDVRPLRRRYMRMGEVDELSLTMAERFARPTFHKGLAPALLKMYRELMTPGLFPFAQAKMQKKRSEPEEVGGEEMGELSETGAGSASAVAATDADILADFGKCMRSATICIVAVANAVVGRCTECDTLAGGGGAEAVDAAPVYRCMLLADEQKDGETDDLKRVAYAMRVLTKEQTKREAKRLKEEAKALFVRAEQRQIQKKKKAKKQKKKK